MVLNRRASATIQNFDLPVSFRVDESNWKAFRDAQNVFSNQGRTDTRFGTSRANETTLGGSIISMSFFKKTNGTRYRIVKVGTVLYVVSLIGAVAHTVLKTGLSATTKHRGYTANNRHIIAIEEDGLFSFDGTTFAQLGQAQPAAPTGAAGAGALSDSTYQVGLTYYASSIGFESNNSSTGDIVTSSQGIDVTNIATTAANALVDKVRIYLKDITANSEYLFVVELNLGTASYNIAANPTSTQIPPIANGAPLDGGGKYLAELNGSTVYAGNEDYKNDVFRSEQFLPDAYADGGALTNVSGNGDITGLATGLYNNSALDQYLVMFKKTSTTIYSEIRGDARQAIIDDEIGCVAHDTIRVINGDIYFQSENGWRVISNGKMVAKDNKPITLGNGAIDDIYRTPGFAYELNKPELESFFSCYYGELDQYFTFVKEGVSDKFFKAYVYEPKTAGFKPYTFPFAVTSAMAAEDGEGNRVIYLGTENGYLISHSVNELRTDVDIDNVATIIDAFAQLAWIAPDDRARSYVFRDLIMTAIASEFDVSVKAWVNFNLTNMTSFDACFDDPNPGFILDISQLDVDSFTDGRTPVEFKGDVNRIGTSLLIGFYQSELDGNIGLTRAQLDYNANGNRNT